MKPQEPRKGVLITIIVLLIIFIPLSICSFVLHKMDDEKGFTKHEENLNHEFYYQNKLYFYDNTDKLIGTYDCTTTNCNYAKSTINDEKYAIDYYKTEDLETKLIQNRYAFLTDAESNGNPFLYDVQNHRKTVSFSSIKNYGIGIEENNVIVEDDEGKFGVLSLDADPKIVIDYEYDFIGLANFINNEKNEVMNDLYVAKKAKEWFLIDKNGAVLTDPLKREIVSYNGQNIIVKDNFGYYLINYNNDEVLTESPYTSLSFTGKYLNILNQYNDFTVYDVSKKTNLIEPIHVKATDKISSQLNEKGKLEILQNEKVIETVDISS